MRSAQIGIIILAAGASARMGAAKQLLEFRRQTFLRRSAETALQVSEAVVVALGARRETIGAEIADLPVLKAENKDWQTGMGGSIKIGLEKLIEANAGLNGAIISVCDQPFVSAHLLRKMIDEFEKTNASVVACQYAATLGVPALFSAAIFQELRALDPQHGAKTLIEKHFSEVVAVPFPEGAFDVDTPEDYAKLLNAETRTK